MILILIIMLGNNYYLIGKERINKELGYYYRVGNQGGFSWKTKKNWVGIQGEYYLD